MVNARGVLGEGRAHRHGRLERPGGRTVDIVQVKARPDLPEITAMLPIMKGCCVSDGELRARKRCRSSFTPEGPSVAHLLAHECGARASKVFQASGCAD